MEKKEKPAYTAVEIVEILKEAKKLGVLTLRVEGVEADFDVQGGPGEGPPPPAADKAKQQFEEIDDSRMDGAPECDDCRRPLLLSRNDNLYCPCWYRDDNRRGRGGRGRGHGRGGYRRYR